MKIQMSLRGSVVRDKPAPASQHQLPSTGMLIDVVHITPVKSVRDLGIYIDADLSMWMHVKKTVSCCFAALR